MDRIKQIETFLAANPSDNFLQHALALEYVKLNDEAAARRLFEEILTRDPGYVGSYYHLAKLLERINRSDQAIEWYEKGMAQAKLAGDQHAYNELRAAFEEIVE